MRRDDCRGFIPRRIGAVETAPQRMEALRAGHLTPNESGLPGFHGLIPRRIGAIKTAPQHIEAPRAGHLTPNESGLPDFHALSRGFIPRRIGCD